MNWVKSRREREKNTKNNCLTLIKKNLQVMALIVVLIQETKVCGWEYRTIGVWKNSGLYLTRLRSLSNVREKRGVRDAGVRLTSFSKSVRCCIEINERTIDLTSTSIEYEMINVSILVIHLRLPSILFDVEKKTKEKPVHLFDSSPFSLFDSS